MADHSECLREALNEKDTSFCVLEHGEGRDVP